MRPLTPAAAVDALRGARTVAVTQSSLHHVKELHGRCLDRKSVV